MSYKRIESTNVPTGCVGIFTCRKCERNPPPLTLFCYTTDQISNPKQCHKCGYIEARWRLERIISIV
jgi:hypothetical protein